MNNRHPSTWHYTRILNKAKYTSEEAREIQSVRRIYLNCLKQPLFPKLEQTPLALVEGDIHKPRYTINDYDMSPLSPSTQSSPLFPIAEGAVRLIIAYVAARDRRWWYHGYPNDPIRLTCATLKNQFKRLANAPCNEDTHAQIAQLKQWLVQLMGQKSGQPIFRYEPQSGDDTFAQLLYNLLQIMPNFEKTVKRRLALVSSRERFAQLHAHQKTLLSLLAQYVFYVGADTPKAGSFSLFTVGQIYDNRLKTQLNSCREGVVFQQVLFHPRVKKLLQCEKTTACIDGTLALFSVEAEEKLTTDSAIPWLDERGAANPALVLSLIDFDKKRVTDAYRKQHQWTDKNALETYCQQLKQNILAKDYLKKTSGLCQGLTTDSIAPFVKLHGLALIFVEYCHYTEALWVLAGFGGDYLICQHIGRLVSSLLEDAKAVIDAIEKTMHILNDSLQPCYNESRHTNRHKEWLANYDKTLSLRQHIATQSTAYKKKIDGLLHVINEPTLYHRKRQLAKEALDMAVNAAHYSTNIAGKLGLKQAKIYSLPELPAKGYKLMGHQEGKLDQLLPKKETSSAMPHKVPLTPDNFNNNQRDVESHKKVTSNLALLIDQLEAIRQQNLCWYHFAGTHAQHQFAEEALPIMQKYRATLLSNPSNTDRERLTELSQSLEALKKEAEKFNKGLWWLLHWLAKLFFKQWINHIEALLSTIKQIYPSPSQHNTLAITRNNELELTPDMQAVPATQIAYLNEHKTPVEPIVDKKRRKITKERVGRGNVRQRRQKELNEFKRHETNYPEMTNGVLSWMENHLGTNRQEVYQNIGCSEEDIRRIEAYNTAAHIKTSKD